MHKTQRQPIAAQIASHTPSCLLNRMIYLGNFLRTDENHGIATPAKPVPENFPTELSTGRHDAVQHEARPAAGAFRGSGAGAPVC
jgi:hypothetical protein